MRLNLQFTQVWLAAELRFNQRRYDTRRSRHRLARLEIHATFAILLSIMATLKNRYRIGRRITYSYDTLPVLQPKIAHHLVYSRRASSHSPPPMLATMEFSYEDTDALSRLRSRGNTCEYDLLASTDPFASSLSSSSSSADSPSPPHNESTSSYNNSAVRVYGPSTNVRLRVWIWAESPKPIHVQRHARR